MKLLRGTLKSIKHLESRINPDRLWVVSNRERLMTQIAHTSKQATVHQIKHAWASQSLATWKKIFVPHSLARSLKPVLSVVVALLVTSAGWIASAYAEPGDVLWDAKNALNSVVETGRLALASDDEQTTLRLSYASKQAHVVKQVAEATEVNPEKKAKLLDESVSNLQKKLDSAKDTIQSVTPEKAVGLVKEASLSTMDISQTLKESIEKAGLEDSPVADTLEKAAAETTKQGLEIVGAAVQKKTESNLEISSEDQQIVKEHIDKAVESIVLETQKAQDKIQILPLSSSSTISISVDFSSSSSQISATVSSGTMVTSSVSTNLNQVITAVKTTIDEQKKTVESLKETDLLKAINTTKVLAEQVTQVIEKVNTQTSTASSTAVFLPKSTSTPPIPVQ